MPNAKDILGINGRSEHYLRFNKKSSRKIADSKWLTKEFLAKFKIPHPETLGMLASYSEVEEFDWLSLTDGFVVKPVDGLGGQGIMVVKKPAKYAGEWQLMDGKKVTVSDLKLHIRDIIEGRYSRNNLPDRALIERRVKIHPKFLKFAVGGTPDVRLIVFNKVPVMAMLRVPTEESKGKSNLHQGALGLGIDMATGITTYGVWRDEPIKYFPGTKLKVNGILIPFWNEVLMTAVKVQFKRPGLGYFGVDVLIDKERGPMVIEINDQPGLAIQLANMAGLKKRLERVEGLEIDSIDKAVRVSKALFAAKFSRKVGPIGGEKQVIGMYEWIGIKPHQGKKREAIRVKVDTGARGTSIDENLAERLGLLRPEHVLWEKVFRSALGEESRKVIELDFKMRGRTIKAKASVTHRQGLRFPIIIGRRDLKGFVVNPRLIKTREEAWRSASRKKTEPKTKVIK